MIYNSLNLPLHELLYGISIRLLPDAVIGFLAIRLRG